MHWVCILGLSTGTPGSEVFLGNWVVAGKWVVVDMQAVVGMRAAVGIGTGHSVASLAES